jgi:metal-sulfur cluster biosynthetic enzyme
MITEEAVYKALETVLDPEIGIDIVNLGFIYDVSIDGTRVSVAMTLTIKGCPMHSTLKKGAEEAILKYTDAGEAEVRLVWNPPWNNGAKNQSIRSDIRGSGQHTCGPASDRTGDPDPGGEFQYRLLHHRSQTQRET